MAERASFHSRDPGQSTFLVRDATGRQVYNGPERRHVNRRQAQDRRTEVRFELSKMDRRCNPGRREDDLRPDFW
ncbi:MAG: hypothetical protein CME59_21085 [Halioglobus sp.]|nr:hypothetical protein [Halioglobus sp.]